MHDFARTCATFARVIVHCPHAEGLSQNEIIDGVEIRRFRYASDKKETLAYQGDMHKQVFASPFRAIFFLMFLHRWRKATKRLITETLPDIVHAHWLIPGGYVAAKALGKRKLPLYVSMHGTDVFLIKKRKIVRTIANKILRRSHGVHFVSHALQESISGSSSRVARDSDLILPMVFGLDDFADLRKPEQKDEKTGGFLFVGRLLEVKGVDVLIRSFAQLREDLAIEQPSGHENWHLDIIGDGRQRQSLEELVKELQMGEMIRFHGSLAREKLIEKYHNANALILPSRTTASGEQEGLGVVLLEAMSAGVPVIGTDCGGIPEIIQDESTGLLVRQNDVNSLSRAMLRLQVDSVLREKLVAAGDELIQSRYNGEAMVEAIKKWYVNDDGRN
jgi:glycosyltransferase involved in cell wall biosynthesis